MKALILGMGSPILADDGVGLQIAQSLEGKIRNVDVAATAMAGLNILELLEGYERVFLVDAYVTSAGSPGDVVKLDAGCGTRHLFSSHGMDFFGVMALGKQLGYALPQVAGIYGIVIGDCVSFGEELSPRIREKAGAITKTIMEDIRFVLKTSHRHICLAPVLSSRTPLRKKQ